MTLCLVWWNTSLAPAGKTRVTGNHLDYAEEMIRFFIGVLNADIIGLCEITSFEIEALEERFKDLEVDFFNGHIKAGRTHFDTCVIYKRKTISLLNYICIEKKKIRRTYKVAQRLDFEIIGTDTPLHLFISHWPSRISHNQYEDSRRFIGQVLRESIDEFTIDYLEKFPIVLMGDYNDEPFAPSIAKDLLATRDRDYISKKKELLYNPFWKHLSHRCEYTKDSRKTTSEAGTYFYKSDQSSRWKTYDQMMFSSALLGNSEWHLNEPLTSTLEMHEHIGIVTNRRETFDHIPIVSVLERNQ